MKRSFAQWYIAKVKYRTEKKIKQYLEHEGIQHFILSDEMKPAIPVLVFIRTDYERALSLPSESGFSISYLCDPYTKRFQVIPDKQMQDFLFLQGLPDKAIPLSHPDDLHGGEKVRVIGGEFAGIEGELHRIRGHKRVVVKLRGVASMATTYIPKEHLEKI
jgi:transcription antitermination factor NusG